MLGSALPPSPDHTFVWFGSSQTTCPFALLCDVEGHLQAGQFYAPAEGLLLKIEADPTPVPVECEGLNLFNTLVDGVLLLQTATSACHFDEALPVGLKLRHQSHRAKQHEVIPLGEGMFCRRRGDGSSTAVTPPEFQSVKLNIVGRPSLFSIQPSCMSM